jgi:hypothetical protein
MAGTYICTSYVHCTEMHENAALTLAQLAGDSDKSLYTGLRVNDVHRQVDGRGCS